MSTLWIILLVLADLPGAIYWWRRSVRYMIEVSKEINSMGDLIWMGVVTVPWVALWPVWLPIWKFVNFVEWAHNKINSMGDGKALGLKLAGESKDAQIARLETEARQREKEIAMLERETGINV